MPDTLASRLQRGIDAVFEARERHLEGERAAAEAAERARREHAERFRALVDGIVRPVLERGGERLRELGHDFDLTDHGLLEGGRFGDDQHLRFGLSLGGRGHHAFAHAGEAWLTFATSTDAHDVTVRSRVLGRDRSGMSPYRRSHDASRSFPPDELDETAVEELLIEFLATAIASTYREGGDGPGSAADRATPT